MGFRLTSTSTKNKIEFFSTVDDLNMVQLTPKMQKRNLKTPKCIDSQKVPKMTHIAKFGPSGPKMADLGPIGPHNIFFRTKKSTSLNATRLNHIFTQAPIKSYCERFV